MIPPLVLLLFAFAFVTRDRCTARSEVVCKYLPHGLERDPAHCREQALASPKGLPHTVSLFAKLLPNIVVSRQDKVGEVAFQ
jgi:hypothetical protein